MSIFAIINNQKVSNLVEAESLKLLSILLEDECEQIIEVTDSTGLAFIGSEISNGKFVPLQPYNSWSFDENDWMWKPPISAPVNTENSVHIWNEKNQIWDEIFPDAEVIAE